MKAILVSISVLFLLPNFLWVNPQPSPVYNQKERFDPKLSYLNSISKLIHFTDSIAAKRNINQSSLEYAIIVTTAIKDRFYHGFSHYAINQNWIAAFSQLAFGNHLASIVDPEKIMRYPYGGCSQQSIVFAEVMNRKGFDCRKIGFPHHYATEIKLGNDWYFFDPNMEPNIPDSSRKESVWKGSTDSLKKYYDRSIFPQLDWIFGSSLQISRGETNATPAPRVKLFHIISGFLSRVLWILPLILLWFYEKNKKSRLNRINSKKYANFKMPVYLFFSNKKLA